MFPPISDQDHYKEDPAHHTQTSADTCFRRKAFPELFDLKIYPVQIHLQCVIQCILLQAPQEKYRVLSSGSNVPVLIPVVSDICPHIGSTLWQIRSPPSFPPPEQFQEAMCGTAFSPALPPL